VHRRLIALALALCCGALTACPIARKDTLSADVCHNPAPPWTALPSAEQLRAAAASVTHVVLGRVRYTGIATEEEHGRQRQLGYVVVDILGFYKGDAWIVHPRMQRAFPLLSEPSAHGELACRQGEELFFFVRLPGREARPWPGGAPDPVLRAFGENSVELELVVPESDRERVLEALAAP
jgi:hypothetical protein